MKIKNLYNWTINITEGAEKLSESELHELKARNIEFYHNDQDCTYWFFMFKAGHKWIEQARPLTNADLTKQEIPIIVS